MHFPLPLLFASHSLGGLQGDMLYERVCSWRGTDHAGKAMDACLKLLVTCVLLFVLALGLVSGAAGVRSDKTKNNTTE